ncbi:hypothetical protein ZIOFF_048112 [Zingiber officinale]|uniref:Uncharacterized protein n=1 Tax=Zingiber officinale TaxID=94328 RepID=A0A8J5G7A9_ZINOF|nr:hypothetical protein ZIOFF_048112 [Zingiber officinale]
MSEQGRYCHRCALGPVLDHHFDRWPLASLCRCPRFHCRVLSSPNPYVVRIWVLAVYAISHFSDHRRQPPASLEGCLSSASFSNLLAISEFKDNLGGLVVTSEALPPPRVVICPNGEWMLLSGFSSSLCSNILVATYLCIDSELDLAFLPQFVLWLSWSSSIRSLVRVLGMKIHWHVKCEGFRSGLRILIQARANRTSSDFFTQIWTAPSPIVHHSTSNPREKIMTIPRKEKKRKARREEKAEKAVVLDMVFRRCTGCLEDAQVEKI